MPLLVFSKKLTETQLRYSMTKIELLTKVETLKEFKGMLCRQRIRVYMNHKNLIQGALGLTLGLSVKATT